MIFNTNSTSSKLESKLKKKTLAGSVKTDLNSLSDQTNGSFDRHVSHSDPNLFENTHHFFTDIFPADNNCIWRQLMSRKSSADTFSPSVSHKTLRKAVAEAIFTISGNFNFQPETTHLAISFLDIYLSSKRTMDLDAHNFAAVCTYMAAKVTEDGRTIPTLFSFINLSKCKLLRVIFEHWESQLLVALDFNLHVRTAMSLLTFLQQYELSRLKSLIMQNGRGKMAISVDKVRRCGQICQNLVNFAAKNSIFCRYPPEFVAASAMSLARKVLGLIRWPLSLKNLTSISSKSFAECSRKLAIRFQNSQQAPVSSPGVLTSSEGRPDLSPTADIPNDIAISPTNSSPSEPKISINGLSKRRKIIRKTGSSRQRKCGVAFDQRNSGSPYEVDLVESKLFAFSSFEEFRQTGISALFRSF